MFVVKKIKCSTTLVACCFSLTHLIYHKMAFLYKTDSNNSYWTVHSPSKVIFEKMCGDENDKRQKFIENLISGHEILSDCKFDNCFHVTAQLLKLK